MYMHTHCQVATPAYREEWKVTMDQVDRAFLLFSLFSDIRTIAYVNMRFSCIHTHVIAIGCKPQHNRWCETFSPRPIISSSLIVHSHLPSPFSFCPRLLLSSSLDGIHLFRFPEIVYHIVEWYKHIATLIVPYLPFLSLIHI